MIEVREVKIIKDIILEQYISVVYKKMKIGKIKIEETIDKFIITSYNINTEEIYRVCLDKNTEDILEVYGLELLKSRKEIVSYFEGVLNVY
jgi:hypothetical protein